MRPIYPTAYIWVRILASECGGRVRPRGDLRRERHLVIAASLQRFIHTASADARARRALEIADAAVSDAQEFHGDASRETAILRALAHGIAQVNQARRPPG